MSRKRDPHSPQPAQPLSRDPLFPVGPAYPPRKLAQLHRNQLRPGAGTGRAWEAQLPLAEAAAPGSHRAPPGSAAGLLTGLAKH